MAIFQTLVWAAGTTDMVAKLLGEAGEYRGAIQETCTCVCLGELVVA